MHTLEMIHLESVMAQRPEAPVGFFNSWYWNDPFSHLNAVKLSVKSQDM